MAYGICVEVWGDRALFTRPELSVERVSYDAMTPSEQSLPCIRNGHAGKRIFRVPRFEETADRRCRRRTNPLQEREMPLPRSFEALPSAFGLALRIDAKQIGRVVA